jgi:dinuclear metal center YbgI/SA1388 family protein
MIKVKDITNFLEQWAPLAYQETYDNAGLIIGDPLMEITGILVCLDVIEAVIEEARNKNCNLIIAHHPIIFKPIKKLTGTNYIERCIMQAIKYNISIYIIHTNLDNILQGVNQSIAQQLDLQSHTILLPKSHTLQKLTVFVSPLQIEQVRATLHQAGAGHINDYHHCSFTSGAGTATFEREKSTYFPVPTLQQGHKVEGAITHQLEVVVPTYLCKTVITSLKQLYPCGELAYCVQSIENLDVQVGAGVIGELLEPLDSQSFLIFLKEKMGLVCVRHSAPIKKAIEKVALCGGAGIFLLPEAIRQGADAFVTADVKYHDFFDAEGQILIADIGHYESEIGIKKLICNKLSEKFSNIVLLKSTTQTNPVYYF